MKKNHLIFINTLVLGSCGMCSVPELCPTLCHPISVAHQVPLSMGFPRQKHWSELPFPPQGDLSDPGIETMSPASPALAQRFFTTELLEKPQVRYKGF